MANFFAFALGLATARAEDRSNDDQIRRGVLMGFAPSPIVGAVVSRVIEDREETAAAPGRVAIAAAPAAPAPAAPAPAAAPAAAAVGGGGGGGIDPKAIQGLTNSVDGLTTAVSRGAEQIEAALRGGTDPRAIQGFTDSVNGLTSAVSQGAEQIAAALKQTKTSKQG